MTKRYKNKKEVVIQLWFPYAVLLYDDGTDKNLRTIAEDFIAIWAEIGINLRRFKIDEEFLVLEYHKTQGKEFKE